MFPDFVVSAESLAAVAGALLSLAFSYIPGLESWYGNLSSNVKRLVMLAALVVVAGAIFGLSCYGIAAWVACTTGGIVGLVQIVIAAAIANQTAHRLTPTR